MAVPTPLVPFPANGLVNHELLHGRITDALGPVPVPLATPGGGAAAVLLRAIRERRARLGLTTPPRLPEPPLIVPAAAGVVPPPSQAPTLQERVNQISTDGERLIREAPDAAAPSSPAAEVWQRDWEALMARLEREAAGIEAAHARNPGQVDPQARLRAQRIIAVLRELAANGRDPRTLSQEERRILLTDTTTQDYLHGRQERMQEFVGQLTTALGRSDTAALAALFDQNNQRFGDLPRLQELREAYQAMLAAETARQPEVAGAYRRALHAAAELLRHSDGSSHEVIERRINARTISVTAAVYADLRGRIASGALTGENLAAARRFVDAYDRGVTGLSDVMENGVVREGQISLVRRALELASLSPALQARVEAAQAEAAAATAWTAFSPERAAQAERSIVRGGTAITALARLDSELAAHIRDAQVRRANATVAGQTYDASGDDRRAQALRARREALVSELQSFGFTVNPALSGAELQAELDRQRAAMERQRDGLVQARAALQALAGPNAPSLETVLGRANRFMVAGWVLDARDYLRAHGGSAQRLDAWARGITDRLLPGVRPDQIRALPQQDQELLNRVAARVGEYLARFPGLRLDDIRGPLSDEEIARRIRAAGLEDRGLEPLLRLHAAAVARADAERRFNAASEADRHFANRIHLARTGLTSELMSARANHFLPTITVYNARTGERTVNPELRDLLGIEGVVSFRRSEAQTTGGRMEGVLFQTREGIVFTSLDGSVVLNRAVQREGRFDVRLGIWSDHERPQLVYVDRETGERFIRDPQGRLQPAPGGVALQTVIAYSEARRLANGEMRTVVAGTYYSAETGEQRLTLDRQPLHFDIVRTTSEQSGVHLRTVTTDFIRNTRFTDNGDGTAVLITLRPDNSGPTEDGFVEHSRRNELTGQFEWTERYLIQPARDSNGRQRTTVIQPGLSDGMNGFIYQHEVGENLYEGIRVINRGFGVSVTHSLGDRTLADWNHQPPGPQATPGRVLDIDVRREIPPGEAPEVTRAIAAAQARIIHGALAVTDRRGDHTPLAHRTALIERMIVSPPPSPTGAVRAVTSFRIDSEGHFHFTGTERRADGTVVPATWIARYDRVDGYRPAGGSRMGPPSMFGFQFFDNGSSLPFGVLEAGPRGDARWLQMVRGEAIPTNRLSPMYWLHGNQPYYSPTLQHDGRVVFHLPTSQDPPRPITTYGEIYNHNGLAARFGPVGVLMGFVERYGVLGTVTAAWFSDTAALTTQHVLERAGVSRERAYVWGQVVAGGFDLTVGAFAGGLTIARTIAALANRTRYARPLQLGIDGYFLSQAAIGIPESIHGIREAMHSNDRDAYVLLGQSIRGLANSASMPLLIGWAHRFGPNGRPVAAPRARPERAPQLHRAVVEPPAHAAAPRPVTHEAPPAPRAAVAAPPHHSAATPPPSGRVEQPRAAVAAQRTGDARVPGTVRPPHEAAPPAAGVTLAADRGTRAPSLASAHVGSTAHGRADARPAGGAAPTVGRPGRGAGDDVRTARVDRQIEGAPRRGVDFDGRSPRRRAGELPTGPIHAAFGSRFSSVVMTPVRAVGRGAATLGRGALRAGRGLNNAVFGRLEAAGRHLTRTGNFIETGRYMADQAAAQAAARPGAANPGLLRRITANYLRHNATFLSRHADNPASWRESVFGKLQNWPMLRRAAAEAQPRPGEGRAYAYLDPETGAVRSITAQRPPRSSTLARAEVLITRNRDGSISIRGIIPFVGSRLSQRAREHIDHLERRAAGGRNPASGQGAAAAADGRLKGILSAVRARAASFARRAARPAGLAAILLTLPTAAKAATAAGVSTGGAALAPALGAMLAMTLFGAWRGRANRAAAERTRREEEERDAAWRKAGHADQIAWLVYWEGRLRSAGVGVERVLYEGMPVLRILPHGNSGLPIQRFADRMSRDRGQLIIRWAGAKSEGGGYNEQNRTASIFPNRDPLNSRMIESAAHEVEGHHRAVMLRFPWAKDDFEISVWRGTWADGALLGYGSGGPHLFFSEPMARTRGLHEAAKASPAEVWERQLMSRDFTRRVYEIIDSVPRRIEPELVQFHPEAGLIIVRTEARDPRNPSAPAGEYGIRLKLPEALRSPTASRERTIAWAEGFLHGYRRSLVRYLAHNERELARLPKPPEESIPRPQTREERKILTAAEYSLREFLDLPQRGPPDARVDGILRVWQETSCRGSCGERDVVRIVRDLKRLFGKDDPNHIGDALVRRLMRDWEWGRNDERAVNSALRLTADRSRPSLFRRIFGAVSGLVAAATIYVLTSGKALSGEGGHLLDSKPQLSRGHMTETMNHVMSSAPRGARGNWFIDLATSNVGLAILGAIGTYAAAKVLIWGGRRIYRYRNGITLSPPTYGPTRISWLPNRFYARWISGVVETVASFGAAYYLHERLSQALGFASLHGPDGLTITQALGTSAAFGGLTMGAFFAGHLAAPLWQIVRGRAPRPILTSWPMWRRVAAAFVLGTVVALAPALPFASAGIYVTGHTAALVALFAGAAHMLVNYRATEPLPAAPSANGERTTAGSGVNRRSFLGMGAYFVGSGPSMLAAVPSVPALFSGMYRWMLPKVHRYPAKDARTPIEEAGLRRIDEETVARFGHLKLRETGDPAWEQIRTITGQLDSISRERHPSPATRDQATGMASRLANYIETASVELQRGRAELAQSILENQSLLLVPTLPARDLVVRAKISAALRLAEYARALEHEGATEAAREVRAILERAAEKTAEFGPADPDFFWFGTEREMLGLRLRRGIRISLWENAPSEARGIHPYGAFEQGGVKAAPGNPLQSINGRSSKVRKPANGTPMSTPPMDHGDPPATNVSPSHLPAPPVGSHGSPTAAEGHLGATTAEVPKPGFGRQLEIPGFSAEHNQRLVFLERTLYRVMGNFGAWHRQNGENITPIQYAARYQLWLRLVGEAMERQARRARGEEVINDIDIAYARGVNEMRRFDRADLDPIFASADRHNLLRDWLLSNFMNQEQDPYGFARAARLVANRLFRVSDDRDLTDPHGRERPQNIIYRSLIELSERIPQSWGFEDAYNKLIGQIIPGVQLRNASGEFQIRVAAIELFPDVWASPHFDADLRRSREEVLALLSTRRGVAIIHGLLHNKRANAEAWAVILNHMAAEVAHYQREALAGRQPDVSAYMRQSRSEIGRYEIPMYQLASSREAMGALWMRILHLHPYEAKSEVDWRALVAIRMSGVVDREPYRFTGVRTWAHVEAMIEMLGDRVQDVRDAGRRTLEAFVRDPNSEDGLRRMAQAALDRTPVLVPAPERPSAVPEALAGAAIVAGAAVVAAKTIQRNQSLSRRSFLWLRNRPSSISLPIAAAIIMLLRPDNAMAGVTMSTAHNPAPSILFASAVTGGFALGVYAIRRAAALLRQRREEERARPAPGAQTEQGRIPTTGRPRRSGWRALAIFGAGALGFWLLGDPSAPGMLAAAIAVPPGWTRRMAEEKLGLAPGASVAEAERAHRLLIKAIHPDVNAGDRSTVSRAAELNVARDVIRALGEPTSGERAVAEASPAGDQGIHEMNRNTSDSTASLELWRILRRNPALDLDRAFAQRVVIMRILERNACPVEGWGAEQARGVVAELRGAFSEPHRDLQLTNEEISRVMTEWRVHVRPEVDLDRVIGIERSWIFRLRRNLERLAPGWWPRR